MKQKLETKHWFSLGLLILISWAVSACQVTQLTPTGLPLSQPSPSLEAASTKETGSLTVLATSTPSLAAPPTATSSLTLLSTPTVTASPTFMAQIGLKWFDPDVKPPIVVSHNEPLIAKSDETIKLKFGFVCAYGTTLDFNATLFVAYGKENNYISIPLQRDMQDEEGNWPVTLPATDADGAPLRYYLQVNDPHVGVVQRFPVEGTIDTFTVPDFIPIDLPAQKPVEPGELVLAVPWGSGPEAVGTQKREGYPRREGPSAMDVAEDGRIALADSVYKRVLIFDPRDNRFTNLPLPFFFGLESDLQFDRNGRLAILDGRGEEVETPTVSIPQLYLLSSDGSIDRIVPVYVEIPYALTKDLEVQDYLIGGW